MDPLIIGFLGILFLVALLALGVPIAFAMALSGFSGLIVLLGVEKTFFLLPLHYYSSVSVFTLTAIPLFLLLGYVSVHGGLTSAAFDCARIWLVKIPGGLAMSTCLASGLFGACAGTGVPATAAMGRIAIPEMLRFNYDKSLAAGSVASAATIAVLVPPSIMMVVYSVTTGASLGKLLLAGYVPAALSIIIYMAMIFIRVRFNPSLAPNMPGEIVTWTKRWKALGSVWGILVLIVTLLGGLYSGFFTPTEAAAVGSLVAFILMIINRKFTWPKIRDTFSETLGIMGMVILLVLGASVFGLFITLSGLPQELAKWIGLVGVNIFILIFVIAIVYVFLGMFLDALSILLLTLPILLPVLISMEVNLIWFGIIYIKLTEIGAITPPVGLSVYVLKGVVGDKISLAEIFRGIGAFLLMDILTLALLIIFPQISLFLPNTMRGG